MMSMFHPFPQPIGSPPSGSFRVEIDGIRLAVLEGQVDAGRGTVSFTTYQLTEPATVKVYVNQTIQEATIQPRSLGLPCVVSENVLTFELQGGLNLAVEVDGQSVYLFHVPPASPPTEKIRRFARGGFYDVGEIILEDHETLWIEPGAIVRGLVRAREAENVHIGGGGYLDASAGSETRRHRAVNFERCRRASIRDVTIIRPSSWMVVLGDCDDVLVENLYEIGSVISSDGIDIVGSRNVTVRGGLLRNNDDNVVIKSFDGREHDPDIHFDWSKPVHDVLVEGAILANDRAGNALEIGHELLTDAIRNVTFRDIDILHVHGHGAPFSINAGDRAAIHDILYENIRVEHHYDKLFSLRVINSRFTKEGARGRIRQIKFKDIDVTELPYNAGYTTSVFGGMDADHLVENVSFENVRFGGKHIMSLEALDGFTRHVADITFS